MGSERRRTVTVVGVGVLALAFASGCGDRTGGDRDQASRQGEVAERGAEVMPFDLDVTTHSFEPTDSGLVETVVADDPSDAQQITLIRGHLAEEASRFERGDRGDPAAIHGDDMPGLAEREAGADAVTIEFAELADGARLSGSRPCATPTRGWWP